MIKPTRGRDQRELGGVRETAAALHLKVGSTAQPLLQLGRGLERGFGEGEGKDFSWGLTVPERSPIPLS